MANLVVTPSLISDVSLLNEELGIKSNIEKLSFEEFKSENSISLFENINYKTLYNLLNSLNQKSKLPKKIVFSSSISVYGEKEVSTHYYENSEKTPPRPSFIYYLVSYLLVFPIFRIFFQGLTFALFERRYRGGGRVHPHCRASPSARNTRHG